MRIGQSMIFEQVMLFGVSVAIFVACYGLFQLYQSHFTYVTMNDQVRAVRDLISAHVLELTKFEGMDASSIVKIPKRVSGELYYIAFTGTGLNVTTAQTQTSASSDFFMLGEGLGGRYVFLGKAASGRGEVIIYKRGNNIILE